jgi:hypothetical protein
VLPEQIIARLIAIYETGGFIRVCAWCGRVKLDDDWFPIPDGALDAIVAPAGITHTVCPSCAKAVEEELRDPNAKR